MILIILSFVLIIGFIIFRYKFRYKGKEEQFWTALAAVATLAAVIVALIPIYKEYYCIPRLELKKPGYTDNFIRSGNEFGSDKRFYSVDIELQNKGWSVAKDCQPFLTAMGGQENKKWVKVKNWAPIGLKWLLTKAEQANEPYPEMRNLAPECPYIFSLGTVRERDIKFFALEKHLIPTGQTERFPSGEYCFEITVYSSNAKPIVRYFEVKWNGCGTQEDIKNIDQFKKCLSVTMMRNRLWK